MISERMKRWIRRASNGLGLEIGRYRPEATEIGGLAAMLAIHKVDLVFDVGANVGQFGHALRDAGYAGRMVSFEPLAHAHAELVRACSSDPQWDAAQRVAVGDHEGEIEIHVAGNSVSSSALPMLERHADAAPQSVYIGAERVRVARLDALAPGYLRPGTVPFLKIDTQGYEDRVLEGASGLMDQLVGLQLEMSMVPLYEGQKLFDAMHARLRESGYSAWAFWPGFREPRSGRMLQMDAIYFRD
jgi:FkbM family methyltransferase